MALVVDIEKKMGGFALASRFEAGNETLAILGASGCGKSMTLKCIAGVETPDRGHILLDGRVLFDSEKKINLPARSRGTGYLFQDYALFPNMTVEQNIACGIPKGKDKAACTDEKISAFYLQGLEKRFPSQLSGGQQQRVALARMLASEPRILMLDEPFSSLDSFLKWQLEQEIIRVQESFKGTILFVSHNRDEVYRLCDRVAVMEGGKTRQVLPKKELFYDPQTLSAALLSGCKNISAAKKTGEYTLYAEEWQITLTAFRPVPDNLRYVGLRAHHFETVKNGKAMNTAECSVERVIEDMFSYIVMLRLPGHDAPLLRYELGKREWEALGCPPKLFIRLPEDQLILMR
jgi:molybdate transport system ATP-binding protein